MFSYTRLEQLRLGLALTPQEKKVIETRYVAQLWHRFMVTQDLAQKTFILKTLRTMALEGNASAIITFLEQQNGVYDLIHGFDNSDGFELKATLHALDEVACQVGTRHSYLAAAALFEIFATEYRYRNQNDKGFTSFCKRYMSETEAVESTLQEYGETGCFYAATVLLNTYQSEHNADKTAYWNKKLELIPEFLKEKALKYFNLMMINLFIST